MDEEDYRKKLREYFKKNLKKGYLIDSLKWSLIGQGYSRTAVERAIDEVTIELAKKAPVLKEKPVIKHEILDEHDRPIVVKKSFWKRLFGY
jgi:hypothetical protein